MILSATMAQNQPDRGPTRPAQDMGPNPPELRASKDRPEDPAARQRPAPGQRQPTEPKASQKAQIVQYLKSQNVNPDDTVWSIGGLNLTLKDLEG